MDEYTENGEMKADAFNVLYDASERLMHFRGEEYPEFDRDAGVVATYLSEVLEIHKEKTLIPSQFLKKKLKEKVLVTAGNHPTTRSLGLELDNGIGKIYLTFEIYRETGKHIPYAVWAEIVDATKDDKKTQTEWTRKEGVEAEVEAEKKRSLWYESKVGQLQMPIEYWGASSKD